VDFSRGFTDPEAATGADMTEAVLATAGLVEIAHGVGSPVIYTTIAYSSPHEAQAWLRKSPGLTALRVGSPSVEIDARLPRGDRDLLDAVQSGYDVLVPRECVADRAQGPHEASLFDMQAKYADVIPVEEAASYLAGIAAPVEVLT
jgi:nicotinamidase-related amidase